MSDDTRGQIIHMVQRSDYTHGLYCVDNSNLELVSYFTAQRIFRNRGLNSKPIRIHVLP